jgi:hypothetical protein
MIDSIVKFSGQSTRRWTTPQLLKGGLVATWGVSLIFLSTALAGVQAQRNAIKTVGLDAAPSIMNAQRIQDSLADMDANVADELLAKPGQNQEAVDDYNKRREKLATLLVAVAENITYDNQERIPIQTIQAKLGDYIQLIQQARDFHARGDEAAMRQAYRAAIEIMDNTLLPAADQLVEVNNTQLNSTYQQQRQLSLGYFILVTITGWFLLGTLVGLQFFLNYRMRRILNPGLLAASTIALFLSGYTLQCLNEASSELKVAKEDAFDSLYVLRKARSLAYRANADKSRYLLDPQIAEQHEQAFQQKVDQIAKVPAGTTLTAIANIADIAYPDWHRNPEVAGFQGFLADELANIIFGEPERAAATKTLHTFATYIAIDQQIRGLERRGQHESAIALCLGNNPNQSNWAFDQYRAAHQEVVNVNMAAFQKAIQNSFQQVGVDAAFKTLVQPGARDAVTKAANEDIHILDTKHRVEAGALTRFEVVAVGAIGAIALLTLLGLLPRLKEYSN